MRARILIPTVLFGLTDVLTAARTDPFNGTHVVPSSAGSTFLMPGGLIARLAHVQMQLNDVISREFQSVHGVGSTVVILTILALAFIYGVVHAAAPGHGKTVVGSYFVGNESRWTGGVLMGSLIALLQGASAIAIVFLMSLVLHVKELQIANQGALISSLSYGVVALIGAVSFWRAATGRGCRHVHEPSAKVRGHDHIHDHVERGAPSPTGQRGSFRRLLIAATGVAPCSSAIVIMLFALANGALAIGVAAVVTLSIGMAVTVSSVGVLGIVGRRVLMRLSDRRVLHVQHAEQALRLLGSAAIVGFAGLLMIDALSRI